MVSILGAILGGTLVAICMALALIGGILAVAGGKQAPAPVPQVPEGVTPQVASPRKASTWLWLGGGVAAFVVILIAIGSRAPSKLKTAAIAEPVTAQPSTFSKPETDAIAELMTAQPSTLQPEGDFLAHLRARQQAYRCATREQAQGD